MTALLGPPWRGVSDPRAVLAGDPPEIVSCHALAAGSPNLGVLIRAKNTRVAYLTAKVMAEEGCGRAYVYEGVVQLKSGRWLWPIAKEEVNVNKIDDPLTRMGFVAATEDLYEEMADEADVAEAAAIQDAAEVLGVPISALEADGIDMLVGRLDQLVQGVPNGDDYQRNVSGSLLRTALIVGGLSMLAGGTGLGRMPPEQRAMLSRLAIDPLTFIVRDYGRRGGRLNRDAREIIARGVAAGNSDRAIARSLRGAMRHRMSNRNEWYYRVVASSAISRARGFGQLVGYSAARVPMYTWEAMMDGKTCQICAFLHGQSFPVATAQRRFAQADAAETPEEALAPFAWYRQVGSDIYATDPVGGGLGTRVASVTEGGNFLQHADPRVAGGTVMPPAHGGCRCTTIPGV